MRKAYGKLVSAVVFSAVVALGLTACGGPKQHSSGGGGGEDELPRQIEMIVPFDAGGGTDVWARFIAPYLQENLPNKPKITVVNAPGGESITGPNKFVSDGATDGSQILVASGSTYIPALLNRAEVKYDFTELIPLGLNGTGGAVYVSSSTGIKSAKDLGDYGGKLDYGGISATGNDLVALLAMDVLDVDMDATFGVEGRGPARIALERGETNIDYQTTSAYLSQVQPMIDEGSAVPLFSFGVPGDNGDVVRDPALPDLPTLEEVYEDLHGEAPSGDAYEAYRAANAAGQFYQKGVWANNGTDKGIVEDYQKAFDTLKEDDEFNDAAKDALGGYPLFSGAEAYEDLVSTFDIEDSVRQYTLDTLKNSYDVEVETK